jgi:hypothetical protein
VLRPRRLLPLLAAVLATAAAAASPAGATVRITGPVGVALPASPAGLSVETDLLPDWWRMGSCQSPARAVLRMAPGAEIRIGGNSQDRLWPTAPLPRGQKQVADARFFHAVRCVGATGAPVLLGLNLLGRDPQATGDLLAAAGGLVPRDQLTIAIGNEPNLYGGRLPGRYSGYFGFYGNVLTTLRRRLGSFLPPVAGPDAAAFRWIPETAQFIHEAAPSQGDAHVYGINGCAKSAHPTAKQLLDRDSSTKRIAALAPVVRAGRITHTPLQISEINSVACRGTAGLSNTPTAALWALQILGDATTAGFGRLQFHASRGFYDAFVVRPDGTVTFRPLWTAMVLADALWTAGTRPLHVTGAKPSQVGLFAARRPGGALALLAVNRDRVHARTVTVRTSAAGAVLGRMTPRGRFAVALNGRVLRWSHGRPAWQGRTRLERPKARDRRLRIRLAPGTAAWALLGARAGAKSPARLTSG